MLADTLTHNAMLQTLKLQGNNIQTPETIERINESLKKNRDAAKARFAVEHPELQTHKLKKPAEPKKKKSGSRSSGRSSRKDGGRNKDGDRKSGSSRDKEGGSGSKSRSSRPSSSSSSSSSSSDRRKKEHPGVETPVPFLEEPKNNNKKSPPEDHRTTKPSPLASKFKGLGLGGGKKKQQNYNNNNNNNNHNDGGGLNHDGLKEATFV